MGAGRKGMPAVLSIAGSDSSGGAGLQADIKTICAHRLYAETVVTALTAQNTVGVQGVLDVPADFVALQMESVFSDIPPQAVKVGMVSSAEIAACIAEGLARFGAGNVVVDPVMVSTSGSSLAAGDAVSTLVEKVFPLAAVVTPNIPEAERLSGLSIEGAADMERAAARIARLTPGAVLVKGGHGAKETACDYLLSEGEGTWLSAERVDNPNTHGTGCTLSSAIACGLATGMGVAEATSRAKEYIVHVLRAQLDLGKGSGPLDHMAVLR